jgi:carbon starvation protein
MIVSPDVIKQGNVGAWVIGATQFTQGYLSFLGDVGLKAYFGMALVIFAITVQALVTRFWRLVAAEVSAGTSLAWFGHRQVSTIAGLVIPWVLAVTGSWINLWLYFGGANQLLAALALWLISIHFARVKAPTRYTLIPAVFMTITTIAALGYQTLIFTRAGLGLFGFTLFKIDNGIQLFVSGAAAPLVQAGQWIALPEAKTWAYLFNLVFAVVGLVLFVLGIRMSLYVWDGFRRFSGGAAPQPQPAPAATGGED